MKLVALAGLPGTGKSTLAGALARRLGAALLDKDRVRAALFAPGEIEYSRAQDDLVMACIHRAVEFHAERAHVPAVVLDGRTYARAGQVEELCRLAARLAVPLAWIECTASEACVRARLEADAARGTHPAANRSVALWERLRAEAVPLACERLVLATDAAPLEVLVERALAHVAAARVPRHFDADARARGAPGSPCTARRGVAGRPGGPRGGAAGSAGPCA